MSEEKIHSAGGYWMLAGIIALLLLPPVIGHFVMPQAEAAPTVHADANQ